MLEVLKRLGSRNFAGGLRQTEKVGILAWIVGISELIQAEIDQEKAEAEEREKWSWRSGDWAGRERERELAFIRSFITEPDAVPDWTAPPDDDADDDDGLPTPFLRHFESGLRLVTLHNELVRKSKRQFEEIRAFHADTAKPYRRAENLRFWIKAAEIRWEVRLAVDVMGVVRGTDAKAWRSFDEAILKWCRAVREEISTEWAEGRRDGGRKPPTLKVEMQPQSQGAVGDSLKVGLVS